jgi:hypothetical protein
MNNSNSLREKFACLSQSGKVLVVIQVLRLLFGLYLVINDQFRYNDTESALTVFIIYLVLGVFTFLFISGNKAGLPGILTLSVILIIFNTVFTFLALGDSVDAGPHDPSTNIVSTVLRYVFFVITIIYTIKIHRERRKRGKSDESITS